MLNIIGTWLFVIGTALVVANSGLVNICRRVEPFYRWFAELPYWPLPRGPVDRLDCGLDLGMIVLLVCGILMTLFVIERVWGRVDAREFRSGGASRYIAAVICSALFFYASFDFIGTIIAGRYRFYDVSLRALFVLAMQVTMFVPSVIFGVIICRAVIISVIKK